MATMQQIEELAAAMGAARDALTSAWLAQHEAIEAVRRFHREAILKAIARFRDTSAALYVAVEGSPELFVKPRTVILHGIKAGFAKGRGSMDWDDDEKLIKRIERLLPEQADVLIETKKKVLRGALAGLDAATLKKLGVEVEGTGDVVVVRLADGEAAKAMKALLKDAPEPEEEGVPA
jgi:hypothetical protein